ncbi:hypothetical protein JY651_05105 [Pyxidicoccus parkwayensis]|uniref:Uncharacterized protein n=1 Tax=Pyxidicoccus parkwayensis TaxID=2813578 RepID=A0ABX7NZS7_9BACT|nr:hypothetical protein [Pyxidicoccus parkwaysis]QSQ24344.1 hypothetical protein JY651_05105 [Pyxidicoccus parkwaysis]
MSIALTVLACCSLEVVERPGIGCSKVQAPHVALTARESVTVMRLLHSEQRKRMG